MKRRRFLQAAIAAAAGSGCSTPGVRLDAPYVVTPYEVVDEMLRLAKVGPQDVVFDLGCGDGRIVIEAARRHGARGVGIDIDPARIVEANAGARRAGVSARVHFAVQDLFQTDFSSASVVTLYLFPEMNAKLRPKLLADLKPGSRIVSHQFGIEGWAPDDGVQLRVRDFSHQVYLWVVRPH
ncbi:MAG TPA: class I SAM-dependent methyltransferase [Burkholderiales bacterium]|nr:class I SAM-dependent methyltransferase [Burkholderiales bacterium]